MTKLDKDRNKMKVAEAKIILDEVRMISNLNAPSALNSSITLEVHLNIMEQALKGKDELDELSYSLAKSFRRLYDYYLQISGIFS